MTKLTATKLTAWILVIVNVLQAAFVIGALNVFMAYGEMTYKFQQNIVQHVSVTHSHMYDLELRFRQMEKSCRK